jgi:hypothetical protein
MRWAPTNRFLIRVERPERAALEHAERMRILHECVEHCIVDLALDERP